MPVVVLRSAEMKRVFLLLTISFLQINRVWSLRGIGGHPSRAEETQNPLEEQEERTFSSVSSSAASTENEKERRWAAMLSTGWTSREVQYGVDQTGDYGAYTMELALRLQNLTLGGWWGFGTGNHYQEWDFTVPPRLSLARSSSLQVTISATSAASLSSGFGT